MFLGIDVGGTHTDAVAVTADGQIAAVAKTTTNHADLLDSICTAMDLILAEVDEYLIERINLSTTLSTNVIVEGRTEDVGVIVSAGPGIDPRNFQVGSFHWVPGAMDHRGHEIAPLDLTAMENAAESCRRHAVKVFAVVGKFSTRNQKHELIMSQILGNRTDQESRPDFISMGHRLSGQLNFPRRIFTSYYNAATWRTYNSFANAIERSLGKRNGPLRHKINILKADAGTMPFPASRELPVETISSGPAASVMGVMALDPKGERPDCLVLDIGGTTTDISILVNNAPVLQEEGIDLNRLPTLVRGIKTVSIGVGGDSAIRIEAGQVKTGPQRLGPAMALGGDAPTLMDAMNVLGWAQLGDREASRQGLDSMAAQAGLELDALAEQAVHTAVMTIKAAADEMLREINDKPVYTIMEMLTSRRVRCQEIILIGGPARAFQPPLTKAFNLPVIVPEAYAVGSAMGAAMARSTMSAEMFADTGKGIMIIPNLGITKKISADYTLKEAEADIKRYLLAYMAELGVHEDIASAVDITEKDSFAMIEDACRTGRNIRVKCQIRPGVTNSIANR